MKILITGGSGILGQYLNMELSSTHNILTLYNTNPGNCTLFPSAKLDIKDGNSLTNIFKEFNPDIVIHAAAITKAVAADELPAKLVYEINVNATKRIAQLCDMHGSKLIYFSTDLVYGGYRGADLDENSKLVPISLYAETKLMGEVKIKEVFDNYIILRTGLLYGFGLNHSSCHFHYMYNALRNGKSVNLFYDQYRSPLELMDAATLIGKMVNVDVKNATINFGGPGRLSRYELGGILCEKFGFDNNLLNKISMYDSEIKYRVEDVSMNINKMKSFGLIPQSAGEAVARLSELNDI